MVVLGFEDAYEPEIATIATNRDSMMIVDNFAQLTVQNVLDLSCACTNISLQ